MSTTGRSVALKLMASFPRWPTKLEAVNQPCSASRLGFATEKRSRDRARSVLGERVLGVVFLLFERSLQHDLQRDLSGPRA